MEIVTVIPTEPHKFKSVEGLIRFGNEMTKQMANNFEHDGYLAPFALVVCTERDGKKLYPYEGVFIVAELANVQDKELFAYAIRQLVRVGKATAVFMGVEAWALETKDKAELEQALEDGKGSLEHHPQRIEVLTATLESRKFGRFIWKAKISRDAAGKGKVEPFELMERMESEGRMTQFFDKPDTKDTDVQ